MDLNISLLCLFFSGSQFAVLNEFFVFLIMCNSTAIKEFLEVGCVRVHAIGIFRGFSSPPMFLSINFMNTKQMEEKRTEEKSVLTSFYE